MYKLTDQDIRAQEEEQEKLISAIVGKCYTEFCNAYQLESGYFMNAPTVVLAISDAYSDIQRAASYHTHKGASVERKAAYVALWIAMHKPIQLAGNSSQSKLSINAEFAISVIELMLGKSSLADRAIRKLKYSFVYRNNRLDGEFLAAFLECAAMA